MVPPRWPDKQGGPIPTYPCPRYGLEVALRFRGFPRGESETRRLATLPSEDLRQLVRAHARDHPVAAAGRPRDVRAGAGGG